MKFQRLILISCLVSGIVFATPASASNFSGPTGATGCGNSMVNMQDNSVMTFSRQALTVQFSSAVSYVLNTDIVPTDIQLAAEDKTPDGNTDVIYYDNFYTTYCGLFWGNPNSPSILGASICQSLSGSKCQQSFVLFSESLATTSTSAYLRSIACHETGHSVGLLHRADSTGCMTTAPGLMPLYTPHDIIHVNANY